MGRGEHDTPDRKSETRPDVTIIVVNYNTVHLLDRMFAAIDAARGNLSIQVIVVDNASHDRSVELLRAKHPNVELIENTTNVGFGRANNQAVPSARGRYLLLLNTDAFVAPDTLTKTLGFMDAQPEYGVLGVKLVGEDGTVQPSCRFFPTPWNVFAGSTRVGGWLHRWLSPRIRLVDDPKWDPAKLRECDWVPGCYYLIRHEVVDCIGLFDPRYFLYFEEVDHCRRMHDAGFRVVYYPDTFVVHIGGESAGSLGELSSGRQVSELETESALLYFRKHYGLPGMLATVSLGVLGDAMRGFSGLVRSKDKTKPAMAARHSWTQLRLLFATRLATRATR